MSKSSSSSDKSSTSSTAGLTTSSKSDKSETSLLDSSLSLSNPGTYEDLHKKTKGNLLFNKYL